MADTTHGWAFLKGLPITGADVTLDSEGAAIGSTCRIVGPVSYKPDYRKKNEDENESGVLVGERSFDLVETLSFSLKLPTGFTDRARLVKGAIVTIATSDDAKLDGVWQIDEAGREYVNDDATMFPLTLRRNAGMTLSAQNPS
jgi:hypothetical protein